MPVKKNLFAALTMAAFVSVAFAAEQEQPTPYDLIRPIYPLTWDRPHSGLLCAERTYSRYLEPGLFGCD